jgi:hypothetical protein
MGNFVHALTILDMRINHSDAVLKEWREIAATQIAIFINCHTEHRAAMVQIPGWVIGTAAKK